MQALFDAPLNLPGFSTAILGDLFSMWSNTHPSGGSITVDGSREFVDSAHREHCPDALVECMATDDALVVRVAYRPDKVVRTTAGNAYRSADGEPHRLSEDEIRELRIDKGEIAFELYPCALTYPEDFDLQLVRHFTGRYKAAHQLDAQPDEEVLALAQLGRRQGEFIPNIVCAILFARDARVLFPGWFVRFETAGRSKDFQGPLPRVLQEVEKVLPESSLRQALVDACLQRAYSLRKMCVTVRLLDDRLEIERPGRMTYQPRNQRLLAALEYFEWIRRGPPPECEVKQREASVQIVVARREVAPPPPPRMKSDDIMRTLSEEERRLVQFVLDSGGISVTDAQRLTGRSWASAKRQLQRLSVKGVFVYQSRSSAARDPQARFYLRLEKKRRTPR